MPFDVTTAVPVRERQDGLVEKDVFDITTATPAQVSDQSSRKEFPEFEFGSMGKATEIRAQTPEEAKAQRYRPAPSEDQKQRNLMELMTRIQYERKGEEVPWYKEVSWALNSDTGQMISKNIAVTILQAFTPGGFLAKIPAIPLANMYRGIASASSPNADFGKMVFDSAYKGLAENRSIEETGGAAQKAYPELPWIIPGIMGVIAEASIYAPGLVIGSAKSAVQAISKEGQIAAAFNKIRNSSKWGDIINHYEPMANNIPPGVDRIQATSNALENSLDKFLKDQNYYNLIRFNIKNLFGLRAGNIKFPARVSDIEKLGMDIKLPKVGETCMFKDPNGIVRTGSIKEINGNMAEIDLGKGAANILANLYQLDKHDIAAGESHLADQIEEAVAQGMDRKQAERDIWQTPMGKTVRSAYNREFGEEVKGIDKKEFISKELESANVGRVLSPEEKEAQKYFLENIDTGMETYKAKIKGKYGDANVAAPDVGKEIPPGGLSPERSIDYHEVGSAAVKLYAKEVLADPSTLDKDVLILGGGSGAGKSSSLKSFGADELDKRALTWDINSTNVKSTNKKIQQALDSGRNTELMIVFRDPVESYLSPTGGVIQRVAKENRIVPVKDHLEMHFDVRPAAKAYQKEWGNNQRVTITLVNNYGGKNKATIVSNVDKLPKIDYTLSEAKNEIYEGLKNALQEGRINEQTLKEALKGSPDLQARYSKEGISQRRGNINEGAEGNQGRQEAGSQRIEDKNPVSYLVSPSRTLSKSPVTQKEIDAALAYAKTLGVDAKVNVVKVDRLLDSLKLQDYAILQTLLGKEGARNARFQRKIFRVKGLHQARVGRDGQRSSYIELYNGHDSETLGHELIHAIEEQGGLPGYAGTAEEHAEYLGKLIASGETNSVIELTPQGSKIVKVKDLVGPVKEPIKLLTYNKTLSLGTGTEVVEPANFSDSKPLINKPVESGQTPKEVVNFSEKTEVISEGEYAGKKELTKWAEDMSRAMRQGKAKLIRDPKGDLYIVADGLKAYKYSSPCKEGNIKVKAYIIDLPAVYTCKNCATCAPTCYAVGAQVQYPAAKVGRFANLFMFLNHRDLFESLINSQLKNNEFSLVRIHSSGDIFSQKYADFLGKITKNNPDKKFYVYTKIGELDLSGLEALPNFNKVNSLLPNGEKNYGDMDYINEKSKEFGIKKCPASLATGRLQEMKKLAKGDKEKINAITAEYKDPSKTIHCANPDYKGAGKNCNLCSKEKHMLFLQHGSPMRKSAEAMVNDVRDTNFIENIQYQISEEPSDQSVVPADPYEQVVNISKIKKPGSVGKDFAEWVDKAFVPISTRLSKIDESLRDIIRKHVFSANMINKKDMDASVPFMKSMSKIDPDDFKRLDLALKNGDVAKIDELVAKHNMQAEYANVRKVLDDIYKRAEDSGMDVGFLENYFPRRIIDIDEYIKFLRGGKDWGSIGKALQEEESLVGRPLLEEEKAEVVNSMIRGFGKNKIGLEKTSNAKERKITELTPEMNAYYKDSITALSEYIKGMNDNIEARRFFGKEKNFEDSLGKYVVNLVEQKIINPEDERAVREIFKSYFEKRGTHGFWTTAKNFSYIATMGSPISAITQIGDIAFALYDNGFFGTVKAALKGKKITKQDIGIDVIIDEFTDQSKSSKAVNAVFKAIGLDGMDAFGKELLINGAFDKLSKKAMANDQQLIDTLQRVFGNEAPQVLDDLKNQIPSDNVKYMLFSELSNFQPISLAEMPEYYVRGGNNRIWYMLKSYTIKQFDAFHNIVLKEKNPFERMKKLLKLAAALILMNATADEIKNVILGRKTKLSDMVVDNILRLVGFSKWQAYQTRQDGLFSTMMQSILPPVPFLDDLYKDAMKMTNKRKKNRPTLKDLRIWQRIPVVGKFYYWWFGGGANINKPKGATF